MKRKGLLPFFGFTVLVLYLAPCRVAYITTDGIVSLMNMLIFISVTAENERINYVKEKLTANSAISTDKQKSESFGIPISKSDSRKSLRIYTKSVDDFGNNVLWKIPSLSPSKKVLKVRLRKKSSNVYGSVKGVSVGDTWNTRVECSHAGVHKPTVAGIHPGKEGAYSVAISGDYEDDQDNGYCFTYTGSGGRDLRGTKDNRKNLRTAPQSRDQTPEGANASLIKSIRTRNPVRVIRGYKLDSPFAPEKGYRYDGLYTVEKYWTCIGKSGFLVYKFLMKRCANQPAAPWHTGLKESSNRIKIVKLRKQKTPKSTVLNLSGKLTMNEGNGEKITTCQLSGMQLKLNTDTSHTVTIGSPAIFLQRECEIQLDRNETIAYQRLETSSSDKPSEKNCDRGCVIKCKKTPVDESNKENNNKVIIKTRWRRTRLSLPNLRSRSSLPEPTTNDRSKRQYKKRLSYTENKNTRKSIVSRRSHYKTPPSIAYFNATNEKSFKWSLFASQAELRKYQKYFRKNNSCSTDTSDDFQEEFRGFERQDSLNKVMILGFIINDLENGVA